MSWAGPDGNSAGGVWLMDPHLLHADNLDDWSRRNHDWRQGGPRLSTPKVWDEYFASDPQDSALGIALDRLVDGLPDNEPEIVRMRLYEHLAYSEIARQFDWWCGVKVVVPNKKRAWRVYHRALRRLRTQVQDRPWLLSLAPDPYFEE